LPASQKDREKHPFSSYGRDDAVKQMISLRSKFQNYKSYANATIEQLFTQAQLKNALVVKADYFSSCLCRNDGSGRFALIPLPAQAQLSALNGIVTDDFDGDGNLDVLINGNDFGTEVTVGRYDALNGLLLKGDGKGSFTPLSILQSGIYLPGNGKGLARLRSADSNYLIAAGENRGPLRILKLNREREFIPLRPADVSALIEFTDGRKRKEEYNYGSSFLSQSARFITITDNIKKLEITDIKGETRIIGIQK